MAQDLRKSGIEVIGDVPWGTHFCQFYQTGQDLVDILVPYFKAGLENNEYCMWITAEPVTVPEAGEAMRRAMPDFDRYLQSGQIDILPHTDWYLKGGAFEETRVLNGWVDRLNSALAKGYAGLRLTGNTFWLEKSGWKSFADYEATVNNIIGQYRIVALCSYCLDKCGATELIDVVENHQFSLIKREGKWEIIQSDADKRTRNALKVANDRLRNIFESITDGFFALDENMVVTYFNRAAEKLLNRRAEDVVGRKMFEEAFPEAKGSVFEETYLRSLREKKPATLEAYFGIKPYENWYSVQVYPNENGLSVFFQVITARKKAEELQRQLLRQVENERARLTAVIQQMPAGVVVAETSGEVILVNSRAEALWHQQFSGPYSLERFDDAFPMFHPDGRRYHITERPLGRALRGETVAGEEIEIRLGDGSRGVMLVSGAPMRDAEGNLVAGVITHLDITERRKAEEALRASEAHLAAILESVPVLTLVVDADRRVLELNDAAVGFSGKPIAEVVGLRGGEALGCLHSLDDPRGCGFGPSCQTCQVRLDVLDTLETGNNHYKVEWRLPFMHDGKVKEMTFLFSTTRLSGSEKQALICIDDITDMKKAETEVKELNETLRQRAAELEAVNHELEAFAYSVSHDLRAPLRSMAGFSDALLEDYGDRLDEQGRQYLNWIKESGGTMGQLIDDLLQLSRVTRAEMRREPVDLTALARDVLAELKRAHPDRRVECSVGRGLTCYGDSRLLRLALENLLENAWKFTGRSPSPRIEVSVTEIDGTCVYFVRDNGAGFDMTYADKLFRPFQRLHRADDFPGTGIGLATVQRIIHRHGGRIWAEGKENEGATFYFALE